MPLFPSDFKQFKHVSTDENSTILRHPKGHEIKIAHKALSPTMRKQLEALTGLAKDAQTQSNKDETKHKTEVQSYADGEEVKKQSDSEVYGSPHVDAKIKEEKTSLHEDLHPTPDRNDTTDVRTPEQKARAVEAAKTYGYADGGNVTQEAPANQLPPETQETRDIYNRMASNVNPKGMTMPITATQFKADGQGPTNFNPETWNKAQQEQSEVKAENQENVQQKQQAIINENKSRAQAGLPLLQVPDVPNQVQPPGSEAGAKPTDPSVLSDAPKDPMSDSMGQSQDMLMGGYKQQQAGIQAGAKAAGALGEQRAAILKEKETAQTDAKAAYQNHYNELEAERQAHMEDIKQGYIDPNQYWTGDKNGNGGHSKLMAGIGMILAGFNPTTSPNAAVNYLKYQMDQNIAAQVHNLGAKQNMLAANLKQFGNLKDATDMTRLMQNDIMQNELQQAAAKAATPMAKAAAMEAAGKLQSEMAPLQQQFAMRRAMMSLANNGGNPNSVEHLLSYMRVMDPAKATEMEGRYVPGVGMATVPVTAAAREQLVSHQKLQSIGDDVLKYSQTHTNLVPGTAEYNTGVQKSMILQQAIREGLLGTVFRESEKPLLQKFVDDNPAGAFKTLSSQPKIRTILESNAMQANLLKKSYGLPQSKAQPQADQPQTKTVNGIKYIRGPNGEAIKVK